MKEKIIGILKEWLQAKDAIVFTDDIAINTVASELEPLINQEVEKRIAERMPSEEDIELFASLSFPFEQPKNTNTYGDEFNRPKRFGFKNGVIWLRSRLTPQVTPQVPYKMEGGGE